MEVRRLEIREARSGDAEEVFSLANQLNAAREIERDAFDRAFPELIADEASCCLVAATGEQINGYACGYSHLALHANGHVAYLDEMVVAEELRHSGIGKQLVEGFEQWAVSRGCGWAALAAAEAGPFYESLGYQQAGEHYQKRLG